MSWIASPSMTRTEQWLKGLIGSGISAAGGAICSGVGAATIPQVSAISGAVVHIMWVTALGAAVVSMGKYLNQHPLPGDDTQTGVK